VASNELDAYTESLAQVNLLKVTSHRI
jgi:hypothetical protein